MAASLLLWLLLWLLSFCLFEHNECLFIVVQTTALVVGCLTSKLGKYLGTLSTQQFVGLLQCRDLTEPPYLLPSFKYQPLFINTNSI